MPAVLLLATGPVSAQDAIDASVETAPPIIIDAEHTDYDLRAGITRFRQDVTIQRGAMLVNADEGRIFQREGEITVIELSGTPATWQDRLDDGKMVHGEAREIHYDVVENLLTLSGTARLRHDNVDWSGDRLVYDLDTESLSGSGSSGERARVVIEGDAMRQRPQRDPGTGAQTPPIDEPESRPEPQADDNGSQDAGPADEQAPEAAPEPAPETSSEDEQPAPDDDTPVEPPTEPPAGS